MAKDKDKEKKEEKKEEEKKSDSKAKEKKEIDYENLKQYTVRKLRRIAKKNDVSIPSGSRKDDIIELIKRGVGVIEVPEDYVYKEIKVEFWRTRLHDEELGVHQQLKYEAKTRWFSKSFDIEGKISIDGEEMYIIAFNKEEWEEKWEDNEEPTRFRLRYFSILEESMDGRPEGGTYQGGIELSIAHSLLQSYEVKRPAPVFFIQIPRNYHLFKVCAGWRLIGTRWTWPLLPEDKGDKFQMVTAKGKIGPGRNYDIYIGEKKVARIDGQLVQKEFEIEIYDKDYAEDTTFLKQLILFACACNFMHDTEDMIKELYKKMEKDGTSDYRIPKSELDLFKNPRMMRR
jgi:hypothetical protein